ncbi:hypothetical protein M405DRAFT_814510 [Rhizopogon salebrosus TDB-379]|nr:hypothetical protein M405DRAFT_814510 [Rhizopogon salebrosus TDB-379]
MLHRGPSLTWMFAFLPLPSTVPSLLNLTPPRLQIDILPPPPVHVSLAHVPEASASGAMP